MNRDRANAGLLVAALGATALAISVFLPWYGVDITASGATALDQRVSALAREYGNANLQTQVQQWEWDHGSLAGYELGTVSAHRVLKKTSEALLVLAGIALLASLLRLADLAGRLYASDNRIALVGVVAGLIVLDRMIRRPDGSQTFVSLALNPGIWFALLSSVAIVAGARIARSGRPRVPAPRQPSAPPLVGRDIASPLAMFRDQQP
jgi:hypothetical protein